MSGVVQAGEIDAARLEVLRNELAAITEEMAIVISRSARSPMVRNGDFATGLADGEASVLGLGFASPQQQGMFMTLLPHIQARLRDRPAPGTVYIANDPFRGWGHMPDVAVVVPALVDGELLGYALAYSHHADMGGRIPGSMSSKSTSSFEEGLRLPVVEIGCEGRIDEELLDLILANVRGPEIWRGDFEAKVAGCRRGAAELQRIAERHGMDAIARFNRQMNQLSERSLRQALAALPSGVTEWTDEFEDDGFGRISPGLPLRFALRIAGDEASVDFAGTSPQVSSGINLPFAQTRAAVYGAFKLLTGPDVLINDGFVRPLAVSAPEGSLVNPRHPAAVGGRGPLVGRLRSIIQRALAQLAPNRIPVPGETADSLHAVGTDPQGRPFVMLDGFFGGWGGRPNKDGIDGLAPMEFGAYGAAPAELIEREYPVLLEAFDYIPDSAGPGMHRGSLALRRAWRFLADADVMIRTSRLTPSPGLAGGGEGLAHGNHLLRAVATEMEVLPAEMHLHLRVGSGDLVEHVVGGFGGWGDPYRRDTAAVLADVVDGKLTLEAAERQYGVVIAGEEGSYSVDEGGTETLRARGRQA